MNCADLSSADWAVARRTATHRVAAILDGAFELGLGFRRPGDDDSSRPFWITVDKTPTDGFYAVRAAEVVAHTFESFDDAAREAAALALSLVS